MRIFIFFLLFFSVLTTSAQTPFDTSALVRDNRGIYSLVIAVKDSIIYNRTFNGKQADDLFNNQSLTKNICAVLIGNQAVDDRSAIRQSGVFMEGIFPMIFEWVQRGPF